MAVTTKTTPIQWVVLLFVVGVGAFLAWAGYRTKDFGTYSPAIMADLALAGMIIRSIFKNTGDDDE